MDSGKGYLRKKVDFIYEGQAEKFDNYSLLRFKGFGRLINGPNYVLSIGWYSGFSNLDGQYIFYEKGADSPSQGLVVDKYFTNKMNADIS